ncbi:MAG TPA: hypothetical protein VFN67_43050 [Polyangiales bacterium]|nr:hypothetical protein [Polyangiales bacterium]
MSSIPNGQEDEWSSASQELFRAARSDHAPTPADRERVRRALAGRIAMGQGGSSGGSVAGPASTLSRVLKAGFGVSLVVVATIALMRAQEPAAPTAATVQIPTARSSDAVEPTDGAESVRENNSALADSAVQNPSRGTAPQTRVESGSARAPRRVHARASVAQASAVARAKAPPTAAAEADSPLARASTAQAAVPQTDARLAEEQSQPAREQGFEQVNDHVAERTSQQRHAAGVQPAEQIERARSSGQLDNPAVAEPAALQPQAAREQRAEPASSKVEEPQDQAEDARAELAFVRKMQSALRAGNSEDVLELSQEHSERWPHGTFVQEREGLRAIASCNTGSKNAAARAKAFLTKYPRTPLGPRVREACKLQLKAANSGAAKAGTAPAAEQHGYRR